MTHTQPTITYGHGFLYDGDRLSGGVEGAWTTTGAGAAQAISEGDFLALTRSGADCSTTHANNLTLSTDTYKEALIRYKCSNATTKAKIIITFTAGTQTILADTNTQTLTWALIALTANKTINTIAVYADTADGTVYYDFVLIYKGTFTIPNAVGGIEFTPTPRYTQLQIPSMIGAHTQNLGSVPAEWRVNCDLTRGTWTRTGATDKLIGEVIVDVVHNSITEDWQWFDSKLGACKVTVDEPSFRRYATANKLEWILSFVLREYRISSAGCTHENYRTRFSIDQVA